MNQMSGKNRKRKKSGIRTSKSLMFPNQKERKQSVVARKLLMTMMILKWMMNSKTCSMIRTLMTMKTMTIDHSPCTNAGY